MDEATEAAIASIQPVAADPNDDYTERRDTRQLREYVFVVWKKHRSGVSGITSVHASLVGAKTAQNGSGAVFEPIEGVPGQWYATLLEGNVEVHIIREELKP